LRWRIVGITNVGCAIADTTDRPRERIDAWLTNSLRDMKIRDPAARPPNQDNSDQLYLAVGQQVSPGVLVDYLVRRRRFRRTLSQMPVGFVFQAIDRITGTAALVGRIGKACRNII
jgi:hypothetical protein